MNRRKFTNIGLGIAALASAFAGAARAQSETSGKDGASQADTRKDAGKVHKVVIQVTSGDPKTQQLALGNAHNYASYYKSKSEPFEIAIVAFGPGYSMLRDDVSTVKGRIAEVKQELGPAIAFYACQNTRAAIATSLGKKPADVPEVKEASDTPSGIVRVAEFQQEGWSYVRP